MLNIFKMAAHFYPIWPLPPWSGQIWKFACRTQYFLKFCTLVNFHNCLMNTLPTSLQPPSNLVLNRNYVLWDLFLCFDPFIPKYSKLGPRPQIILEIVKISKCSKIYVKVKWRKRGSNLGWEGIPCMVNRLLRQSATLSVARGWKLCTK